MTRQIFVDTETTGFDFKQGHRIIEFGGIEMIDRKLTGNKLHFYFKPDIEVEAGALAVHGISNEFLADKPVIESKLDEIMQFLQGAELVIHNAAFDVPFLNWELSLQDHNPWGVIEDHCEVLDTLIMARKKHPGQKNSLDALCARYGVSNKHRQLHGALLDAQILAEVYLMMTGGQTDLFAAQAIVQNAHSQAVKPVDLQIAATVKDQLKQVNLRLSNTTCDAHRTYLELLDKKSNSQTLWKHLNQAE
ncbi:DNA polymerase III subunit epsilon [Facilibium subflavum]|uniref:DNA polymerase III subunit epsilon n=1 Tax=Facilibium subflavum TaxID=2219058 RepID=UPI000E64B904|nr:DNA polymerase III subunit epsilon [Facilibium subflavum]